MTAVFTRKAIRRRAEARKAARLARVLVALGEAAEGGRAPRRVRMRATLGRA